MIDPERPSAGPVDESQDSPSRGPSLALLYSLIALALAAAIGLALMIVLPFHHRR
jgi:hypothetical protein